MGKYLDLAKAVETADICGKVAIPCLGESLEPVGFESDRECEKSETSEKRVGLFCPPGGRVALLQVPDGVPAEWAQGIADLLAMPPHPDWPEVRWKVLQDDALMILKAWAAQAHALGWTTLDLFSVHANAPRARLDGMGLVPLLDGRLVAAITADSAIISGRGGHALVFHKPRCRPRGCVPLWNACPK